MHIHKQERRQKGTAEEAGRRLASRKTNAGTAVPANAGNGTGAKRDSVLPRAIPSRKDTCISQSRFANVNADTLVFSDCRLRYVL